MNSGEFEKRKIKTDNPYKTLEVKIPKWCRAELKAKNIELDKIDLKSYSKDIPFEIFLFNEYGIEINPPLKKKDIKLEQETIENVEIENIKREVKERKEQFDLIIQNSSPQDLTSQEVISAIQDYNLYGEDLVISTLTAIATGRNVINCGQYGTSKSWATRDLLTQMNIPFNSIHGHQTAKSFFENLERYNNSVIVIDESILSLSNIEILDMLLSALQKQEIIWETTKEKRKIKFTGTIIFNSNYLPNSPVLKAVCDRTITNKVKLSSNQLKERLVRARTYKFDKVIWDKIKNNLFTKYEINEQVLGQIYQLIDKMEVKSMRDIERMRDIAITSMKLTNSLALIKPFFKLDTIDIILGKDIKKSEIVKQIAKSKKVSIRMAQKIVKKEMI